MQSARHNAKAAPWRQRILLSLSIARISSAPGPPIESI
jgi:hypothetical protein